MSDIKLFFAGLVRSVLFPAFLSVTGCPCMTFWIDRALSLSFTRGLHISGSYRVSGTWCRQSDGGVAGSRHKRPCGESDALWSVCVFMCLVETPLRELVLYFRHELKTRELYKVFFASFQIVATAVLSILIMAPVGAATIGIAASCCLHKPPEVNQDSDAEGGQLSPNAEDLTWDDHLDFDTEFTKMRMEFDRTRPVEITTERETVTWPAWWVTWVIWTKLDIGEETFMWPNEFFCDCAGAIDTGVQWEEDQIQNDGTWEQTESKFWNWTWWQSGKFTPFAADEIYKLLQTKSFGQKGLNSSAINDWHRSKASKSSISWTWV